MREPFFVVTTGRSGSVSLALTFSQHPHVCALHESQRGLIRLSYERLVEAWPGERREEVVNFFRVMVPHPAGVQVCGLVDQKLSAFIPELAEAWPGARFVWLVRDGRSVVASGYERGWYDEREEALENPWARWRWRGNEIGVVAWSEWEGLDAFGRNCWYWAWVNQLIRHELHELSEEGDRWRMVRLEQLGERGELEGLVDWFGLPRAVGMEMVRANRGPGRLRWETWSEGQRGVFGEWCGEEMEALGY